MNTTAHADPQENPPASDVFPRGLRRLARSDGLLKDFASFFAPRFLQDDDAYRPRRLFAFIEDAKGHERWILLREISTRKALALHLQAGEEQAAVELPADAARLLAVGVTASKRDKTRVLEIDLDGSFPNYDPKRVARALVETFGEGVFQFTSGSGKHGRFRARAQLDESMFVDEMQALARRIMIGIGFPPKDGGVEIYPRTTTNRLPYGTGGCRLYTERLALVGEKSPEELLRHFADLTPIDLPAVAERFPAKRIRRPRDRFDGDPRTRVERPRATPRHVRLLENAGVGGWGQRQSALRTMAKNQLFRGRTMEEANERIEAWVRDENRLKHSKDVQRNGIPWQLERIPELVEDVFASIPELGVPEPEALSPSERERVRRIAEAGARRSEFSVSVLERFMLLHLPAFKGAEWSGLPMLRYHCRQWQADFGRRYARMREACGIFRAVTGYKSIEAAGGRAEEAYAMSWVTTFGFDGETPEPVARRAAGSLLDPSIATTASIMSSTSVVGVEDRLVTGSVSQHEGSNIYPPDCMCAGHDRSSIDRDKPKRRRERRRGSGSSRTRRPRALRPLSDYFLRRDKWRPSPEEYKHVDTYLSAFRRREEHVITWQRVKHLPPEERDGWFRRLLPEARELVEERHASPWDDRPDVDDHEESSVVCPADPSGPTDD